MAPKARAGQRTAKDSKASQGNNDSEAKILCDEAAGHLKTGNYKKALSAYNSRGMAGQPRSPSASEQVQGILSTSRDAEVLQSFLRVDAGGGVAEDSPRARSHDGSKPPGATSFSQLTQGLHLHEGRSPRRRNKKGGERQRLQEEVYTDKDRAAAVVMGSRDIKQSLRLKRKQDRSRALQIPAEAEPGALLALGSREMRSGNVRSAIGFVHKALELNPGDKNALVARSKCYLLLGEPQLALQDAETALQGDKSFIRGLFQKAESLYHLGDFEHSLMYYHRGLRLRPELESFRLGVQKAQEAIENTIGSQSKAAATAAARPRPRSTSGSGSGSGSDRAERARGSRPASTASQRQARHLLGELSLDKQYLEQLLRHPDIKTCSSQGKTNNIATFAEEGIAFLNNRQEFWRQQRPTTTSKKTKEHQQTTKTTQLVH
ncbi:outer dynein arm-docking complex subunit 4-like [Bacillus rossius redtenbacheri]|uniref:outer dynein arm-docking complex subunit 4-like n=1 Tax=Bacillus rossius redtenbacheri TaxID=93214 RepID=UPI002FDEAF92